MSKAQIPCDKEHRNKFKQIASNKEISMTDLFHEWVDEYLKRQAKKK